MKPSYHLKKLSEIEKKQVQDLLENHLRSYEYAERHCEADLHGRPMSLDLKIDKTNEQPGHCKYAINFHLHMPHRGEHVIKKEGFDLSSLMKDALHAMDHHIDHIVESSKSRRHKGHGALSFKNDTRHHEPQHELHSDFTVEPEIHEAEHPQVHPGLRMRRTNHKRP